MKDASTWTKPRLTVSVACQTDESEPVRPTITWLKYNARALDHFVTERRSLLMTLKKLLRSHLKMPSMQNASLHVTIPFNTIPGSAWMGLFPATMMEWHQQKEAGAKNTFTGLMLDPMKVMLCKTLDLSELMSNAMGPCKAVVSPSGSGAQTILSYVPPIQLWHQARNYDGTMESMISLFMIILDESGEMRTPPNHTYTDEETTAVKDAVLTQANHMYLSNVPLSPLFEQLIEDWELVKLKQQMEEDAEAEDEGEDA